MLCLQYLCQVGDGVKFLESIRLYPPLLLPGRPEDLPVLLSSLVPGLLDDVQSSQTIQGGNVLAVSLLRLILSLEL